MPEFAIVSLNEAKVRTIPGRQGKFLNEYATYIQQLPPEQAGKLHPEGDEKPATIRHRLTQAAQVLGMQLVIRRSGEDVYLWSEDKADEQPRSKRRYTRREMQEEESTPLDQAFVEVE